MSHAGAGSKSHDRFGSRLCENAEAEAFHAMIEPRRNPRGIIVTVKALVTNQCFVWAAQKQFLHSLGQNLPKTLYHYKVWLWGKAAESADMI